MGFVQPTEGYMNFRWLSSVAGDKVRGAWFDHIECEAEHFVDQAFQSVLAGARELTLFNLGNVVAEHPGDALLARRWPELRELAGRVTGRARRGIVFYKPVNHHGDENLYLADYLGMLGLPVLPEARWPDGARVVFLGAQAAGDPAVLDRARGLLEQGGTLICTPAFLRAVAPKAAARAGVAVSPTAAPAAAAELRRGEQTLALTVPVDVDAGLRVTTGQLRAVAMVAGKPVPWLVEQPVGAGRVWVWNVRTFSDADFRATANGCWPRARSGCRSCPNPWRTPSGPRSCNRWTCASKPPPAWRCICSPRAAASTTSGTNRCRFDWMAKESRCRPRAGAGGKSKSEIRRPEIRKEIRASRSFALP
jgi:hypothetical protein